MPADFNEGFFVREAAWHRMGVVLPEYPTREEAMRLAGHDFTLTEVANGNVGRIVDPATYQGNIARVNGEWRSLDVRDEKKGLYIHQLRDGEPGPLHGNFVEVLNKSHATIINAVAYDFAEALLEQGFKYECGVTLKDGALCAITLKLDEPFYITGDTSFSLPYLAESWAHDGSGALKGRSTTIRNVCANTVAASEAEGKRLGTNFTIRHTKNWRDRVEMARKAIQGVREDTERYREAMEAFAEMTVEPWQREKFALAAVLDQTLGAVPKFKADVAAGKYSPRVQTNVENAQRAMLALFDGPTIPEAHKLTGYGLFLAGGEYFDHIRRYDSDESYVGRTLLRDEPSKARLPKLIRDLVAV